MKMPITIGNFQGRRYVCGFGRRVPIVELPGGRLKAFLGSSWGARAGELREFPADVFADSEEELIERLRSTEFSVTFRNVKGNSGQSIGRMAPLVVTE